MKATRLLKALAKAGKRACLVGEEDAGAVVVLDIEGRWFAVLDGEVVSRVNMEAIEGQSTRERYLNPGGDGLWPAPEGTSLGYQYAAGAWRVPPGLIASRFHVTNVARRNVTIAAEIDLVNNVGVGVPTIFRRHIFIRRNRRAMTVQCTDSIVYVGRTPLSAGKCLLAPWSLCQFDSGPGCYVEFPCVDRSAVWDLYDASSDSEREWNHRTCRTRTDGSLRYQLGTDGSVPWIEFHDPRRGLHVRRSTSPLLPGHARIDIRDASPDALPSHRGVRYSIYSDSSQFMEIEAAGGCPTALRPNAEMKCTVCTRFLWDRTPKK